MARSARAFGPRRGAACHSTPPATTRRHRRGAGQRSARSAAPAERRRGDTYSAAAAEQLCGGTPVGLPRHFDDAASVSPRRDADARAGSEPGSEAEPSAAAESNADADAEPQPACGDAAIAVRRRIKPERARPATGADSDTADDDYYVGTAWSDAAPRGVDDATRLGPRRRQPPTFRSSGPGRQRQGQGQGALIPAEEG
jgi:hypothetical protein